MYFYIPAKQPCLLILEITSIWLKQKVRENLQKLKSTEIKAKVSLQIVFLSLLWQYPGRYRCNSFQLQPPFETHTSFTYISSRTVTAETR